MALRKESLACALACAALMGACGDDVEQDGQGEIRVSAYGEAFLEEGIPASAVSDGWAIAFDSFEVAIRDVVVAGVALQDPGVVDLVKPSNEKGQVLGIVAAPAGAHTDASFTIAKLHIVGVATKGRVSKTFDWIFDKAVNYSECETSTEVEADVEATFQITVHADHFLYDSIVSEEPVVAFQAFADADADDDGEITEEELAARDIGAFDPGNDDETDDLWSWLEALSRTVGHVDGEGHCHALPEDA